MIAYVIWLMNTYNFEQEIVKLGDSVLVILAVRKPV